MQKKKWAYINSLFFVFSLLLFSCQSKKGTKQATLKTGQWRMEMNLGEIQLPFQFEIQKADSLYQITIINGQESIVIPNIQAKSDSLFIKLPVFDSEFQLKIIDSTHLSGSWNNNYRSNDYHIAVEAKYGAKSRFGKEITVSNQLHQRYEISFQPKDEEAYKAIGLFMQNGNELQGTFATETGDYRHLAGQITNDSIFLSTFNGADAYLFKAAYSNDSIHGVFWSGNHYQSNWSGIANDRFLLTDPDSLTSINNEKRQLDFHLPNAQGKLISLSDEQFQNKVVIVQIMGSWCPNCMDETDFLADLYKEKHSKGLVVVGLAFERTKSKEKAFQNLKRLKQKTNADYLFLLAGWNKETKPTDIFPNLNHFMSFPTSIILNRKGDVVRVHTGFYGPGTGSFYEEYSRETKHYIDSLLKQ